MPRRVLDLLPHVIITVKIEDICDKIKGVLVVLDICIEAGKIEAVRQVIFIYLAEVFVPARRDKLQN